MTRDPRVTPRRGDRLRLHDAVWTVLSAGDDVVADRDPPEMAEAEVL